ncbi:hypothetical protein BOTBODRAFT_101410 [Botryobasidium botryosum FD-172 SS1]|uniref:AMP-dependent synthetase/ligase domain-containing protein n=1 Tax=Botryobasidium botryosum (strain FD-172 SS1) TaxID=930990 RepID=A0A067N7X6_BOTB1|nr:hypothetical protein BOTBODRAFT_101410 [Botryobasidium botryosum FD-172 SS1]
MRHRLFRANLEKRACSSAVLPVKRSYSTTPARLTLSSVAGPITPPLLQETLPVYFSSQILPSYNDRPALISKHEKPRAHGGPLVQTDHQSKNLSWNFEEMDKAVAALARGLVKMGVRQGDRVGVILGNNSAYAMLQWACARAGAVIVTINPAYKVHELIAAMSLVSVSTLFVAPSIKSSQYLNLFSSALSSLSTAAPGEINEPSLPHLRNLVVVNNGHDYIEEVNNIKCAVDFREVLVWEEGGALEAEVQRRIAAGKKDDIINLQFTSGTTGMPKAVSLTHHNLLNNAYSIGSCMRLTPEDKICNVPPLFHCFDKYRKAGNLAAWVHRASIVYASETYDPVATLRALKEEECTGVHGVPTHFLGLLAELEKDGDRTGLHKMRTGIAAGSPTPISLMNRLIEKLNLTDLTNAYGMTETSPVSFQTVPSDSIIHRTETVGRVLPHVKAKVIDKEGKTVPIGSPGELCVSGYLVQKGYWEDPEQTASVYQRHDGDTENMWMHTGDSAIMDESGYLKIVGRIKDIIIRGGENLFPVQIENKLTQHPSIREAAVVSVPDPKYGEVVGAWIVRHPTEERLSREEVRKWVKDSMNHQNAPAWVWFMGEDGVQPELPKTGSGKVQKNVLREWSAAWAVKGLGEVGTR